MYTICNSEECAHTTRRLTFAKFFLSPHMTHYVYRVAGVTILLSLTVFLNMVSETMPVTSDNPLLGNSKKRTETKQNKKTGKSFLR